MKRRSTSYSWSVPESWENPRQSHQSTPTSRLPRHAGSPLSSPLWWMQVHRQRTWRSRLPRGSGLMFHDVLFRSAVKELLGIPDDFRTGRSTSSFMDIRMALEYSSHSG